MSKQSNYITPDGARKLRDELTWLWKEERPRVTQGVSDAAAEGDRSENAEYIYGKKRLREIDRRIRFLTQRLDLLTVVDAPPPATDKVFFGAWVRLENEEGDEAIYRVVGPDETDAARGYISLDSPMGKALLGRREGDEVLVRRPAGEALFTLVEVGYRPLT
ncbi:transcription elongation factor GreB [Geobacter pickeringii]|uniref:Transcription elongation factor GreB n=1 Tax=Geobacter pickeringii TaxID=345632 RepID=A0A0B5BAY1_9BACT|nr:transcription elongation factor GreB [Geobacter pickeringii]AJE03918.1 transcription elongation factor GreB [Geobacter pickeringii]